MTGPKPIEIVAVRSLENGVDVLVRNTGTVTAVIHKAEVIAEEFRECTFERREDIGGRLNSSAIYDGVITPAHPVATIDMEQSIKPGEADRFQLIFNTFGEDREHYQQEVNLEGEKEVGQLVAARFRAKLRLRVNHKVTIESDTFDTGSLTWGFQDPHHNRAKSKRLEDRLSYLTHEDPLVVAGLVDQLTTTQEELAKDALQFAEKRFSEKRFSKKFLDGAMDPMGVLGTSLYLAYKEHGFKIPESLKKAQELVAAADGEEGVPEKADAKNNPPDRPGEQQTARLSESKTGSEIQTSTNSDVPHQAPTVYSENDSGFIIGPCDPSKAHR